MTNRQIAREISYAHSASGRSGRTVIRLMENVSGRIGLIRRVRGYDQEVAGGADFWEVICARYGLDLQVVGGSLDSIPTTGPLILVANHPYGILDGLMMGRILSARRQGDFKVLAHKVFAKSEDLGRVILPISFDETKQAVAENLATRRAALDYLGQGGAIGVFPGGTVSTAATPFSQPLDPIWRSFTAKMIAATGATVVPVFFEGRNSRMFQLASHLHYILRMGLLMREFRARLNKPVRVVIGEPIDPARLAALRNDPKACMAFLRAQTYALSPKPVDAAQHGHEFEAKHKPRAS